MSHFAKHARQNKVLAFVLFSHTFRCHIVFDRIYWDMTARYV